jgi:hypothetical protein
VPQADEGEYRLRVPNHLAFLQVDLTDAAFHRITLDLFRATEGLLRGLLDEALAGGELTRCDTAALARALLTTTNGSLLLWAIYREGTAGDWLARDIGATLGPYLLQKPRPRRVR